MVPTYATLQDAAPADDPLFRRPLGSPRDGSLSNAARCCALPSTLGMSDPDDAAVIIEVFEAA